MATYDNDGQQGGDGAAAENVAPSGVFGYGAYGANPYARQIDLGTVAPVLGGGLNSNLDGPEYLDYDVRGRDWGARMFYNCGTTYLLGIFGGGIYGVIEGFRKAPSRRPKIILNSVLNASALRGSRAGNALGVLAMIYSCWEGIAETVELEKYVGDFDVANPIAAATATGLMYKATQGPKTMVLAGAVGGAAAGCAAAGAKMFAKGGSTRGWLFF